MENRVLTVKALNAYLAYKITSDLNLKRIFLKGEISNVRRSKGHYYFVLKDDESEISGIMFENYTRSLDFTPIDGMSVLVEGNVSVYAKKGTYNFNVIEMQETGLGEIYLKFIKLKERLTKEGIFDVSKKLSIPKYLEKIGIITSATGEALHDILTTINKRFPLVEVYLYPSLVQGPNAPASLIKALKRAIKDNIVDLIIIGRGGGSMEDLSCFNDEALARLVSKSPIPTISAVGHEMDYTIIDFAASFRTPTPTAAAIKATPNKIDIIADLDLSSNRLNSQIKRIIAEKFNKFDGLINSYGLKNFINIINAQDEVLNNKIFNLKTLSPLHVIEKNLEHLKNLEHRMSFFNISTLIDNRNIDITEMENDLNYYYKLKLKDIQTKIEKLNEKINLVNPLNIMKKGYALVYKNNTIIKDAGLIKNDEEISVKFYDSSLVAKKVR